MTELDPFTLIEVTDHAVERAFQRLGWEDAVERIRVDVRVAIVAGRVTAVRPDWTRSWTEDEPITRSVYRFVWDAEACRCWLLDVHLRDRIKVVTCFASAAAVSDRAEERHVRKGMKRRSA